jgi:hypothetical protein
LNQIDKHDFIVFLTSRTNKFKEQTENFLRYHNIRYDIIIFDVPHGERILINDKKPSGLITAIGIALDRNNFDFRFDINEKL